jgi:hypothetical protein
MVNITHLPLAIDQSCSHTLFASLSPFKSILGKQSDAKWILGIQDKTTNYKKKYLSNQNNK